MVNTKHMIAAGEFPHFVQILPLVNDLKNLIGQALGVERLPTSPAHCRPNQLFAGDMCSTAAVGPKSQDAPFLKLNLSRPTSIRLMPPVSSEADVSLSSIRLQTLDRFFTQQEPFLHP